MYPKIGVFEVEMEKYSVLTHKGTSLSDSTFFELQHMNICQRV